MPNIAPQLRPKEGGFVILFFLVCSTLLMMSLAFAVDIGRAQDQQRQIQIAADAAALSALGALGTNSSYSRMLATVRSIAQSNAVSDWEVLETPPRCGVWSNGSFVPSTGSLCDQSSNAVEVSITRHMPSSFARILNKPYFTLRARAIGYLPPPISGSCIRPFGVESSFLSRLNLPAGATFDVQGTQGAGNWGKLDIGGNMSSGNQYTEMMLNNVCHEDVGRGNSISVGTGNAQIEQVFQALLDDTTPPFAGRNMILAVTSNFTNGNGSVVIDRFMKVDLLNQSGSGSRWRATFQVVELDSQPEPPTQPSRQLVQ